eukprot:6210343-Pleurochrysis_carterae.AAC.2
MEWRVKTTWECRLTQCVLVCAQVYSLIADASCDGRQNGRPRTAGTPTLNFVVSSSRVFHSTG